MPTTWSEITHHDRKAIEPSLSLRPLDERVRQVHVGAGLEQLAVHTLHPYGVDSRRLRDRGLSAYLLRELGKGADYTLFDASNLLTLEAATLGNGPRNIEGLLPVYRHAGSLIRTTCQIVEVPDLGVRDLAVSRENGTVVLLPPLDLAEGAGDAAIVGEGFVESMRVSQTLRFPEAVTDRLVGAFGQGLEG